MGLPVTSLYSCCLGRNRRLPSASASATPFAWLAMLLILNVTGRGLRRCDRNEPHSSSGRMACRR